MPPRINQAAIVNKGARDAAAEELRQDEENERLVNEGEDFEDLNQDERATRAVQVVRELYKRYQKQTERWQNYVQLFSFLIFVSVFLSVLFLQRNAQVAYAVHSTIKDTLVPGSTTLSSSAEVLDWLQNTLEEVWKDPVCGDGVCETPFEFASYGRFGCRADCGKLQEVQNLTTVMIDLKFNFKHPVGSVPSTELMQQAKWNLCPRYGAPHGTDCYYDSDKLFDRVEGEVHLEINDVPDGHWILVVKRDIFNKVAGAVRNKEALEEDAFTHKIRIAAESAEAGRNFEVNQLALATELADMTYPEIIGDYLNTTWMAYEANVTSKNATGLFNSAGIYNETLFLEWQQLWYPFKDPESGELVDVMQLMPGDYLNREPGTKDHMDWYKATLECSNIPQIYDLDSQISPRPDSPNCIRYQNITVSSVELRLNKFLSAIFTRIYLADQAMKAELAALKSSLAATHPEVVTAIEALTGKDPENNPALSTLTDLATFYLEPIPTGGTPPVFKAPLSKTRVLELEWEGYDNQTASFEEIKLRIEDRIAEIGDMGDLMDTLTEVIAMQAYMATEASETADYNYVSWTGGSDAYMTTNLTMRAPDYQGTCREDVEVTQTVVQDDNPSVSLQYLETRVPDINDPSTLRFIDLAGCVALCYCPDTVCANTASTVLSTDAGTYTATYCECDICLEELQDPTADTSFVTIQQSFIEAGTAAGSTGRRHMRHRRRLMAADPSAIANHKELLHLKHAAHRRLQQTDSATETELLTQLITDVGSLGGKQTTLSNQVSSLEQEVIAASAAAEARAADKTLEDLINAGREDIKAGQAKVEELLNEIIEKQNEAAAAAQEAAAALAQIQTLQTQMAKSQQLVELGVQKQLNAIMVAGQQQMITLADALTLWRKARVDRLKYNKQVLLSNMQTSNYSAVAYPFEVKRYENVDPGTARERHIGLTNRVIAGMLLHTTRTIPVNCSTTRFDNIDNTCSGPIDISQYGVDPVFKSGADMYNPDLDNELAVTTYYNCSELLLDPTYDLEDSVNPGATTNPAPYCAELYNTRNIPWGFHHFPLQYFEDGFPVWFDINLSELQAQRFYKYVEEGLFLDGNTRNIKAQVVTYNSELRVFSSTMITFKYSDGGSIDVSHKLHTVRVELYADQADYVRLFLEIFLTIATLASLASELYELFSVWRKNGSPAAYFKSMWNWIDLTSIALLWCTMCMWWIFVLTQAFQFDIDLRYDVYDDLTTPAAMLRLAGNGTDENGYGTPSGQGLEDVQMAFGELQSIVDSLAWYYAINGINILFLIARVLKLMDFQPRLGVVTRSLALAGPDLAHFVLVCGMVFIGYAMMAHLIFGNNIQAFSSFGSSVDTCFEILLGEIGVNSELRALTGLQGLAGTLFFWSFELLVFMVLLNFLLAIIVDAFSEVKENTTEQTGLHTEVGQMIREKWRSVMSCFGRSQHIPDRRLGQLLKQWGGEDSDDEDDGGSGEKHVRLLETNLNADELTGILQDCLANAQGVDYDAETGKKKVFGRRGKSGPPTQDEIALAAEYVVARFGTTEDDEEEDEEEDDDMSAEADMPVNTATGERLYTEKALEKERDALAQALDRLSDVQRQLAEGQSKLMSGQSQLKSQHERLLDLMSGSK